MWPSALFLIINIDPGENAFPSSEQKLEIHTEEVADKFFRLAFGTRKLGVVYELNSKPFSDYITNGATHPDLFQEPVIEPPERFNIGDRIVGFRCPGLVTLCQRDFYCDAISKSRLRRRFVVLEEEPVFVTPKVEDVQLPCVRNEHPDAPNRTNLKAVRSVVVVGWGKERSGPKL